MAKEILKTPWATATITDTVIKDGKAIAMVNFKLKKHYKLYPSFWKMALSLAKFNRRNPIAWLKFIKSVMRSK